MGGCKEHLDMASHACGTKYLLDLQELPLPKVHERKNIANEPRKSRTPVGHGQFIMMRDVPLKVSRTIVLA
jgi:hypothetical protein